MFHRELRLKINYLLIYYKKFYAIQISSQKLQTHSANSSKSSSTLSWFTYNNNEITHNKAET